MNENKDINVEIDNEANRETIITSDSNSKKGKDIAISSVVIGVISFLICAMCLYFSIGSVVLHNSDSSDVNNAIGVVFYCTYSLMLIIPSGVLALLSLGLGIGALAKTSDNKTGKSHKLAISGVSISAISLFGLIVSFVLLRCFLS